MSRPAWKHRLHEVIFEADTRIGKAFDVVLLVFILGSMLAVMLESVPTIDPTVRQWLKRAEWFFTILFTLEYLLRMISVDRPAAYARSFFGIVDLVAIVPTYVSAFIPGAQTLLAIRVLRLLRVFRVLKLVHFVNEAGVLSRALVASRRKITVFLGSVISLTIIMGSVMYLVEGGQEGTFASIPESVYWAIVTLTTVGYGDLVPVTPLGKVIAGAVMIMGYSIIAVPTGIVSVELAHASQNEISTQACPSCAKDGHDIDARHCKYCGTKL